MTNLQNFHKCLCGCTRENQLKKPTLTVNYKWHFCWLLLIAIFACNELFIRLYTPPSSSAIVYPINDCLLLQIKVHILQQYSVLHQCVVCLLCKQSKMLSLLLCPARHWFFIIKTLRAFIAARDEDEWIFLSAHSWKLKDSKNMWHSLDLKRHHRMIVGDFVYRTS